MQSPFHKHELERVNPLAIYSDYNGHWNCDICKGKKTPTSFPFHCNPCSFDLCYSCANADSSPAHRHPLMYTETSKLDQKEDWKCAVCKKTPGETFSYHCLSCPDFGICCSCFEPRKRTIHAAHNHVLKLTHILFLHSWDEYVCHNCREERSETFLYHCPECQFDACLECCMPRITALHDHPLYQEWPYIYNSKGEWSCDNKCGKNEGNPFHCNICKFDLCFGCIKKLTS